MSEPRVTADTVIAHPSPPPSMASMTTGFLRYCCLDRLAAAIETGAPEHRIAQLRATYEQAEARYLAHLDSWINVVGAIGAEGEAS